MPDFIPYGRQSISEADIAAVAEVLRGDWLTTGPGVTDFETDLASAVDAPHAVACCNATAALHLALAGLGVGEGDVCIVPAITFLATANAALYCGADVEFCDVDAQTGLMTPEALSAALARAGGRARAVLPVHLAGQTADMHAISALAREAGLSIVEDSAHAVGSVTPDGPVGACRHSDAAIFSFHPVKTLAAGEGGMVTTRDRALAARMERMRSHGIERDAGRHERQAGEPWWHEMQTIGWNYRLTDMQAALARSQLSRLAAFKTVRADFARRYDAVLADIHPAIQPMCHVADCDPCLHLYAARIDFDALGTSRADVMAHLREAGIGTQVHYIPLYQQPFYRRKYGQMSLDGAEAYYRRTLSLPLYVGLPEDAPERVAEALSSL